MGTFGISISSSDSFADIYDEYFDLYNKGAETNSITNKILEKYWEMLEIEEEKNTVWFAIALAQWETKALDQGILQKVEEIINSGDDINIWKKLGASEKDIEKRKIVLNKFLNKIKTERPKAKTRKKKKIKSPIFSVGDCLLFQFGNGNYGGAIVLGTDTNPETGCNLIATTRINQSNKPDISDFENADVLVCNFGEWKDKPYVTWCFPDLYFKKFDNLYSSIGKIAIQFEYDPKNHDGKGYLFKPYWTAGWNSKNMAEKQFESEKTKEMPKLKLSIKQLTNK